MPGRTTMAYNTYCRSQCWQMAFSIFAPWAVHAHYTGQPVVQSLVVGEPQQCTYTVSISYLPDLNSVIIRATSNERTWKVEGDKMEW